MNLLTEIGKTVQTESHAMQDLMASGKCTVRIYRTISEEELGYAHEDVSASCKNVIAQGSVCELGKPVYGANMKSEVTTTQRTPDETQSGASFVKQKTWPGVATLSTTISSYSMNQRPSNRLPKLDPSTVGKDPGHEKEYLTTMSTTTSKLLMNQNSPINRHADKFAKHPGYGIE